MVAVGRRARLSEVLDELRSLSGGGGAYPVIVQASGAPLDGELARLRLTRIRHMPRGNSLDGRWEVAGPDGSVRSVGATLTDEVTDVARELADQAPVDVRRMEVAELLARWSEASGWEATRQFFRTYRADLMAA
jgi:hypothetical protein